MEAMDSISLGAMGSLQRKLDELLHTGDWPRQLREVVGSIRTKLVRLLEVQDPPHTVNYWMKDVRELSYDIDDCVAQIVHADTTDAKVALIEEISGFRSQAEEMIERYDRFKLEYVLSYPTVASTVGSHCLGTVYSKAKSIVPVCMEGPTNQLLRWLEPKGDDVSELQLKVLSILGAAGVGKSTLALQLWRRLGEQFECRAFVQAAKKPDMRMILRSILSQVGPKQLPEDCKVPNLIHVIRKHLEDKRYFVIIDDIWAVSVWDALRRAFPEGYCYSRIITTTTIEDVALACCSYDPEHIFKLKPLSFDHTKELFVSRVFGSGPLSFDHTKELFVSRVFGSGKGCAQQFHDIADEIVRKCSGLPLAVTSIATLVVSLPETVHQWEFVQNFLCHNLRTNSTSDEVLKQVLKLCYYCLPQSLKTCLLYLSVYPENYIILKEDLAKQWVAEGFICTIEGKDNIEVAQGYFDELASLGMIQLIEINSKKKKLSYVVHPVVLDFITCKSNEDNFITVIDYSQSTIQLFDKIRRLSLHFGSATYATTPVGIGLSQVRSLAFMGLLNCIPSLEEFKLVRVVILHFQGNNGDTNFPLAGICGLLLLRYLQVRCNVTVELPDQIQRLKHLETLEINARVAAVPSGILNVSSLLHVHLGLRGKTNPTQGPVASSFAISLDDSSSPSFTPIFLRRFELLPPICIFPSLPVWIRQLHKLCVLEVVVRELQLDDISVLTELPALTALSLYVRTPTARYLFFSKVGFPALEYFKFVCSELSLGFRKEAMPNLRRLKIGFNAQRGKEYKYMLPGNHNLLNLQDVGVKIGADTGAEESDRRAAESAFKDAFGMHPCYPSLKVKRVDRVDRKYGLSEKQYSGQQKESPNERDKVQCEPQREEALSEKHKILVKMPEDDSNKQANMWTANYSTASEVHSPIRKKSTKSQRESVVMPRNIVLQSSEEVMDGSFYGLYKAGSSRYEEIYKGGDSLIREIGRDLTIMCLVYLPRSYYYNVACVNRSFCSLVRSGELYRLRREARIVEQMIYCSCNVLEWDGFDPCRQRWFSIPPMPSILGFTLANKESLAVGTNILVFGRRVEAHAVLRYSLLTNSWTKGEMMNTARSLFGSASFGEKAIVAGGIGENGTLSSAELYDSEMQTWTTLPSMNRARKMCSGFFMDGKFYVIGGKGENYNEILTCAEEFDLENGTWRLIPDMAEGLNSGSGAPPLVAVVNNELYAADYASKEVRMRKYDKKNNAWIALGLLPGRYTSVHGWGMAFRSCGDMLIVVGGMSVDGSGVIEICSWKPNYGPPDWKIIGTRSSGSFVYNCAVMDC